MDTLRILAELHAERERIDQAIAVLKSLNGTSVSGQTSRKAFKKASPAAQSTAKKRVISPEGRMRMAEAQQKRWAKKKKAAKAVKAA